MRTFFTGLALACLASVGCLKTEPMTMEEVLKAKPTEDQFVKKDTSVRAPMPETCLEAGRMYESLSKDAKDPQQQRGLAWRAKQAYGQAERLKPNWAPALAGQARMLEVEGNIPAATQQYQACLQLCNTKGDAACCHEAGLYFTRQKQFDAALAALGRATQLEPSSRPFAMNYGYTLARAGRFEESHHYFSKILSPADAAYQVALMARHVGEADACRRFCEQASLDPQKTADAQALLASLNQASDIQQAGATQATP
jgi:tetratricopeptide (TPR) repeat protein